MIYVSYILSESVIQTLEIPMHYNDRNVGIVKKLVDEHRLYAPEEYERFIISDKVEED